MTVSHRYLPKAKANNHIKPYWTDEPTTLSKDQKAAWRDWVSHGRPRDSHNQYWIRYKNVTKNFRLCQRRAERDFELKSVDELCQSQQVYQRYVWSMINKHKNNNVNVQATRDDDANEVLYQPSKVQSSWFKYFKNLHQPSETPH